MRYVIGVLAGAALIYCIICFWIVWTYVLYVRRRRQWFIDNPAQAAIVKAERLARSRGDCIIVETNTTNK